MKMIARLISFCVALFDLSTVLAHEHFAAGIVDSNGNGLADAGEPLALVGETGDASAGKIFHLLARPVGQRPRQRCGGYYMLDENPRTLFPNDSFSLVALTDGQNEIAEDDHAHTGANIWVEITKVTGPAGAKFGFWDENWSQNHDAPSVSFTANQPVAPYRFRLSEGSDAATEDPYGHIHGRSWTANQPGDYYLSFRLVDRSTTGPGGGPWHSPSESYIYHFHAGPAFTPVIEWNSSTGAKLTWPSRLGYWAADFNQTGVVFSIERTADLTASQWKSIGTVTGTTADTATFTDPNPPPGQSFYRLKYNWEPQ